MNIPTQQPTTKPGFTLVELLVTLTIVSALAAIVTTSVVGIRAKAKDAMELSNARQLGIAVISWSGDYHGRLPRSSHSAIGNGELGWMREILPYLGQPDTSRASLDAARATSAFGVSKDENPPRTPALNVYFEVDPEYDDYEGAPQTWSRLSQVPDPSRTVMIVPAFGRSDHVMAQYFTQHMDNLPAPRPGRKDGWVLWADGRATREKSGDLFDPARGLDRFHPAKTRR